MQKTDALERFTFDNTDIRGERVHLTQTQQDALAHHDYPALIRDALSQLMCAAALLGATLKFSGRMTLQVRTQGAVSLLQAESTDQGTLRAIARFDANELDDTFSPSHLGEGTFVLTIEPEQGQRYQGITRLNGSIAGTLEQYFEQSEQLPSRFMFYHDAKQSSAIMLQQLPGNHNDDPDAWDRLTHLLSTLKPDELAELDTETLLHRLYHEEAVRLYPAQSWQFECTCSKDRIAGALAQMGQDALNEMLEEQNDLRIDCEFCFQHYQFSQDDIDDLFAARKLH